MPFEPLPVSFLVPGHTNDVEQSFCDPAYRRSISEVPLDELAFQEKIAVLALYFLATITRTSRLEELEPYKCFVLRSTTDLSTMSAIM
jgi:hypothetical protein